MDKRHCGEQVAKKLTFYCTPHRLWHRKRVVILASVKVNGNDVSCDRFIKGGKCNRECVTTQINTKAKF